jgi:hypothetical protein
VTTPSADPVAALLARQARKTRILARLRASQRLGAPRRFPDPSCKELQALCGELEGLEAELLRAVEREIASPAARRALRAGWARVREANALERTFAEAWLQGGVFAASEIEAVCRALAEERGARRAFARDFLPRGRGHPQVRRIGRRAGWLALEGVAPVRIDPARRAALPLLHRRLAPFPSRRHAVGWRELHRLYLRSLREAGLRVPWTTAHVLRAGPGCFAAWVSQERVVGGSLRARLRRLPVAECRVLVRAVWGEAARLWRWNDAHPEDPLHVGVPGDLAAWGYTDAGPCLLDTGAPRLLRRGRPLLDPRRLLPELPEPLATVVEPELERELARSHDLRAVLVDGIAGCALDGRPGLRDPLLELADELARDELSRWVAAPLRLEEVRERERRLRRAAGWLRAFRGARGLLAALAARTAPGWLRALQAGPG